MKFNRLLLILWLSLTGAGVHAQVSEQYFKEDKGRYGGFYHAYEAPEKNQDVPVPKGYTPFYISHYGRHGCRWHIEKEAYTAPLSVLKKAEHLHILTRTGERFLEDMKIVAEDARGRYGDLTPRGAMEHRGIARRMYRNYPEVFRPGAEIDSRSTVVVRCVLSMAAFDEALLAEEPRLVINRESSQRNMYYMSYSRGIGPDRKRLKNLSDSLKKAWIPAERFMSALFTDAGASLSLEEPSKFVYQCFEIAALMEDAAHLDRKLDYLFTEDEYYRLWKFTNARAYMYMGPSSEYGDIRLEDARPLLRNMVETAEAVIAGEKPVAASLRFGHDNNIMALMALMEIEGTAARVPVLEAHKYWNITQVSPMATNLQWIFFRNRKGDIKVRLLLNERPARLPIEGGEYYDWKEMKTFLQSKYQE